MYSEYPCSAAGVFTTNVVKAAPVIYNMEVLRSGSPVRAIVVNSGVANACTGEQGLKDARRMAEKTADVLKIPLSSVLVSSTGVIGVPLPMDKVEHGIEMASSRLHHDPSEAAHAIMTTDTRPKVASRCFEHAGKMITVFGMAKGAGMIHPNMATMLAFLFTDARVTPRALSNILRRSADLTYNMISVDGDTSTNDMVLLLANGASETPGIDLYTPGFQELFNAVNDVNEKLAKMIVSDGEGATKVFEVRVEGAKTDSDARLIARSITSSNLVKTAIYGADANWGRILAAAGYSGAWFNPENASLEIGSNGEWVVLLDRGTPVEFDEASAKRLLSQNEIVISLKFLDGNGKARAWGCDLTERYVEINGRYRT
ncbi:MAG: glutamate N-acetyltransferase / amino-acid N-acetyltransferase [Thermotogota bacterium]|nr:glutamate N-acetyltransferase / amino-acid N-acetyltransferase [Thermotogota bacterium]